jgi:Domain of unknown function (DUF4388)
MSITGNLEHFPLGDVIQLLHMTAKSGILVLSGEKGNSQLVFYKGFLVSANHLDSQVRIGKVLVEMNAITEEQLDDGLLQQSEDGVNRKPLVATLIERGVLDKRTAYIGLEKLIEMTIVEVLTWRSGSFSLGSSSGQVTDEYRYFPERFKQVVLVNTEGVLMDSLRIYDEKMRDSSLNSRFPVPCV